MSNEPTPMSDEHVAEQPPLEIDAEGDAERQALQAKVAQLEVELAASRKRVDELARAYQAAEKDREEFKQRVTRERERMLDVEKGEVAVVLIEAIDQLELSLQGQADSPIAQGVKLIRDNLLKALERRGVKRVDLVGQPYDPNLAEATDMEVTTDEAADQTVSAMLSAAYQLKERVIRPGRVRVAKYVKPASA